MRISPAQARRLAIWAQGLDGRWRLPAGKEGVARTIERLGSVQIDTISVVERAHHHILWSRRRDYAPEMLHELHAVDRRVFEGWTSVASYIPMCDYRYHRARMEAFARSDRMVHWRKDNAKLARTILKRIRDDGPLGSSDFADPRGKKRGWWDWKPAKVALENLFAAGNLMIAERRGFQRRYDLTERVLPADVDVSAPDPDEVSRFPVRRALGALGIVPQRSAWWRMGGAKAATHALADLIDAGEVVSATISGADGHGECYLLAETLDRAPKRASVRRRLHILSPFDPLVADRLRLSALFGFDQKLEAYTPAAKRRYGYFCLPILWGQEFVGRLDAKADRKARTLIVKSLMLEPGVDDLDALIPALAGELRAFADFNKCERMTVERTQPANIRAPLRRELA